MLPGEGVDTDYPVMRLAIDIVLGALRSPRKVCLNMGIFGNDGNEKGMKNERKRMGIVSQIVSQMKTPCVSTLLCQVCSVAWLVVPGTLGCKL